MTTISFTVPGEPKGQPRPRAFAVNGMVRVYNPATAEGWKSAIATAAKAAWDGVQLHGPLFLSARFHFARPKSHYRRSGALRDGMPEFHTSKPDLDNLLKALMDALVQIGVVVDDRAVVGIVAWKDYDTTARTWVELKDAWV